MHELKHDGYRLQIHVRDGRVRLYTMNGNDWTKRYPRIVESVALSQRGSRPVPGIARIVLLTNIGNPNERLNWKETERAAQFLGVAARLLDVRKIEDIGRAFDSASEQRTDALVVAVDGFLTRNRQLIADLAVKHRLPAIYPSREFIDHAP